MLWRAIPRRPRSCHQPPFGRDAHEVRLLMAGQRPRGDTFDISPVEPGLVSSIKSTGLRPAGSSLLTKGKKSGPRSAQNRLRIDLAADATTFGSRPSYRGVKELLRDLFNIPISVGTIHNRLQSAAGQACAINRSQNLSAIRVGLHDEIFQGSMPVLAGVDAASTYCYLLADAEHRDADTWAVHLLYANAQGFDPDHTIADAGQGLRPVRKRLWATHHAMAMSSTFRSNARAWPMCWLAWRWEPHHGARRWT